MENKRNSCEKYELRAGLIANSKKVKIQQNTTLIHQHVPYMHSLYQLHDAARRYTNNRTTVFVVLAEYEVGGYHLSPFPKF